MSGERALGPRRSHRAARTSAPSRATRPTNGNRPARPSTGEATARVTGARNARSGRRLAARSRTPPSHDAYTPGDGWVVRAGCAKVQARGAGGQRRGGGRSVARGRRGRRRQRRAKTIDAHGHLTVPAMIGPVRPMTGTPDSFNSLRRTRRSMWTIERALVLVAARSLFEWESGPSPLTRGSMGGNGRHSELTYGVLVFHTA